MELKEARRVLREYADKFEASGLHGAHLDAADLRLAARAPRTSPDSDCWRIIPRAHDLHGDCVDGRHCGEVAVCPDGEREDQRLEEAWYTAMAASEAGGRSGGEGHQPGGAHRARHAAHPRHQRRP